MAYTVLNRGFRRPRTTKPIKGMSIGKPAAQGISAVQKSLDTLDKMHETRLKNTGLLDDYQWTHTIHDKTQATEKRTINMFKKADREASLRPSKYYKRTTTPTFERLVVNPEYLEHGGTIETVKSRLEDAGYKSNEIRDILIGSQGVEVVPHNFEGPLLENQIIGKEPSRVQRALDWMEETSFGKAVSEVGEVTGEGLKHFGRDLGEVGKAGYDELAEFGGDISKSIRTTGEFGEKIIEGTGKLGKYASDIASKVGGVAEKAGPFVSGAFAGKRAVGGIQDITGGNVGQGVEDVVQSGVDVTSTALMTNPATFAAGATLKGLNLLEDMFFDKT